MHTCVVPSAAYKLLSNAQYQGGQDCMLKKQIVDVQQLEFVATAMLLSLLIRSFQLHLYQPASVPAPLFMTAGKGAREVVLIEFPS